MRKVLALIAAFVVAVAGVGAVLAQNRADTPINPFASDPAAPAAGRAVFEGTCAACHGSAAVGGRAPALNTGRFSRGDEDHQLFSVIHDGIPGTGMPPFAALPDADIWRVVTYLKSLSAAPAPAAQTGASAAAPPIGDPELGRTIFFGKGGCGSCHEVNGRGLHLAADLSDIGARGVPAIREGLLHASRRGPQKRVVEAVLPDGSRVRGMVRVEDSFTLHLITPDGGPRRLDRRSLRSLQTVPGAAMPTDVDKRLSAQEMEHVVAYLDRQKERQVQGSIPQSAPVLAPQRLVSARAEPHNWLTYWGRYDGHHFTELSEITPANVGDLQARWAAQLPGTSPLQSTPIVVDGVMYVSGPPGDVYALDAETGQQLWRFSRKQDVVNPYQINPSNRGVAVLDGKVFMGTLDNLLIAIDARTGRALWERRIADTMEGYTMTGAPLALPDRIIVGVGAGEYGIRGFLDAYDPNTGKRLWRFMTVPGPGEPGNETWAGDSWEKGGGGTWLTGSYDPELKLLYWTVGNPAPGFNPHVRAGDNLHTNSVVALDPATGKLRWHYQFTPNDSHDWDAVADLVLTERVVNGRPRKVLLHADRNGFFYMLDRVTGEFLKAEAFVRQSWNDRFDARGRPIRRPGSVATPDAPPVYPAVGATNFQAPSYDERTGAFYVAFLDTQAAIASAEPEYQRGRLYVAGRRAPLPGGPAESIQGIKALDADTGRVLWTFPLVRNNLQAGVLGSRGGVLFAASAEGNFIALDIKDGTPLWRFQTGRSITASPMSYAVNGRQFVAVSGGNTVYSFALPQDPKGTRP